MSESLERKAMETALSEELGDKIAEKMVSAINNYLGQVPERFEKYYNDIHIPFKMALEDILLNKNVNAIKVYDGTKKCSYVLGEVSGTSFLFNGKDHLTFQRNYFEKELADCKTETLHNSLDDYSKKQILIPYIIYQLASNQDFTYCFDQIRYDADENNCINNEKLQDILKYVTNEQLSFQYSRTLNGDTLPDEYLNQNINPLYPNLFKISHYHSPDGLSFINSDYTEFDFIDSLKVMSSLPELSCVSADVKNALNETLKDDVNYKYELMIQKEMRETGKTRTQIRQETSEKLRAQDLERAKIIVPREKELIDAGIDEKIAHAARLLAIPIYDNKEDGDLVFWLRCSDGNISKLHAFAPSDKNGLALVQREIPHHIGTNEQNLLFIARQLNKFSPGISDEKKMDILRDSLKVFENKKGEIGLDQKGNVTDSWVFVNYMINEYPNEKIKSNNILYTETENANKSFKTRAFVADPRNDIDTKVDLDNLDKNICFTTDDGPNKERDE